MTIFGPFEENDYISTVQDKEERDKQVSVNKAGRWRSRVILYTLITPALESDIIYLLDLVAYSSVLTQQSEHN